MISGDLRLTATAASRRLRRGRVMTFFTYRIISLALLTTAITAFLTLYIPNPLTISSIAHESISTSSNYTIKGVVTRREASIAANSSVNGSLPPPLPPPSPPPPPLVRRKSFNDNNANSGSREVKKTASLRRREPAYWRMSPDDALKYAIKEIDNALEIVEDPDLYTPLFKNMSVFKRQVFNEEIKGVFFGVKLRVKPLNKNPEIGVVKSYELMEKILKVYIYRDGKRPIFHTPELRGIYASEGWFMKLMEENRRFVTLEPQKAHLFYLPYSSRQLENALYVPDSHDLKPLSIYLRDYVNWIAGKYSFWNRTRGSDHFLVACHDWGPYTTTAHEELCKNTIKALCNADTSEGIFIKGKDVSLPETTIRNPRRPLRFVGSGRPVSQRSILAFFAGNVHGRVRPVLLEQWAGKDPDMHIYGPLPDRVSRKMTYIQHMKTSKYCICPMGFEVNSPRIVEAIYYECVPVIIADNFVLPFEEVLDWSAFSVVVPEKDIPNLKNILLGISLRRYLKMHTCVKMLQKHFLWHPRPVKYDLYHMLLHSIWFNRINQVRIEKEH